MNRRNLFKGLFASIATIAVAPFVKLKVLPEPEPIITLTPAIERFMRDSARIDQLARAHWMPVEWNDVNFYAVDGQKIFPVYEGNGGLPVKSVVYITRNGYTTAALTPPMSGVFTAGKEWDDV